MKKCPYCGTEFPDDASVCPSDQHALVAIRAPGAPPPIPPIPPRAPAPPGVRIAPGAPARPRSSPVPIIVIIAIVVAGGIFFIGLLVAIAIPNFTRARQTALINGCANNLIDIGLAAQIWARDNQGQLPTNLIQLSNVLQTPNILICIADAHHTRGVVGSPADWDPANVTYQLLTPGASLANLSNKVIVRCPVHGLELLGDGTVRDQNGVVFFSSSQFPR